MKFILILLSFLLLVQSALCTTTFDDAFDYQELQHKTFKIDNSHGNGQAFLTQFQKTKSLRRVVLQVLLLMVTKSSLKFQSYEHFLNKIKSVLFEQQSPDILNIPPPSLV